MKNSASVVIRLAAASVLLGMLSNANAAPASLRIATSRRAMR